MQENKSVLAALSVGRFISTGPETLGTRQCETEGEEAGSTSRAFRHRAYLPDTSYKEAVLSIVLDILGVNLILQSEVIRQFSLLGNRRISQSGVERSG
jgi:hypothetical protein